MIGKQIMYRGYAGRIALLLCLLYALNAFAIASVCAETPDPAPVRVGYYQNEVFQEGAEEGAVKTGYAYEYYRKISEYTGWEYQYVYDSWDALYQMLLDGEIDLLAGLAWREDRADKIGYPKAVMGRESYYLVKQDMETDITADPPALSLTITPAYSKIKTKVLLLAAVSIYAGPDFQMPRRVIPLME